jgi:hypothetical protein
LFPSFRLPILPLLVWKLKLSLSIMYSNGNMEKPYL